MISENAPLYEQVEYDLSQKIFSGQLPPGSTLMTEEELCERYRVSRITVRRAVDELVRRRLLYRKRGVGTFIADPNEQLKAVTLTGYIEDVLPFSKFKLLKTDNLPPSKNAQEIVPSGRAKFGPRFVCVNHLDNKPFSYAHFFFGEEVADCMSSEDFASSAPPIRIVEARSGQRVTHAIQRIQADIANPEVTRHLKLKPNTPLLRVTRVYFSIGEAPLECVEAYYHPERYRFTVDLLPRAGMPTSHALAPAELSAGRTRSGARGRSKSRGK